MNSDPMISFDIIELNPTTQAVQIQQIMQAAYRIEAELLNVDDFFPLRRSVENIASSPNRFVGCLRQSALVGVCELEEMEDGRLLIASTVVDPAAFRQGVASRLLRYVLDTVSTRPIVVSTAVENQPAVRLYQKHGFVIKNNITLPDGMQLVELQFNEDSVA